MDGLNFVTLVELAKSFGTPGLTFIALTGVIVWLSREYLKIRRELNSIKNEQSKILRAAIVEAWTQISELQNLDIDDGELRASKEAILRSVELTPINTDGSADHRVESGEGVAAIQTNKQIFHGLWKQLVFGFFGGITVPFVNVSGLVFSSSLVVLEQSGYIIYFGIAFLVIIGSMCAGIAYVILGPTSRIISFYFVSLFISTAVTQGFELFFSYIV